MSSFNQLNKTILQQLADEFAVDYTEDDTKKELIAALQEDGVTWAMYKETFPSVEDMPDAEPKEDDKPEEDGDPADSTKKFTEKPKTVLVKMTRANGSFQIRGYNFTREHPFLPVSEEDAIYLTEEQKGFKIANPRELEEYYS